MKKYYRRKENGVCTYCGEAIPEKGFQCRKCKDLLNERRIKLRDERAAQHLCTLCGKPLGKDTHRQCFNCRVREARYYMIEMERKAVKA